LTVRLFSLGRYLIEGVLRSGWITSFSAELLGSKLSVYERSVWLVAGLVEPRALGGVGVSQLGLARR
jgi:hypothetical protein